ncbi:uncharacterized protein RAG0_03874 [Rhynchosporium agropyri]|uniref:Uncharacterized protein n=1 Tax=Rhynchosporium agropyri TaxID=914238 RepID=A0A1E1K6K9_9HELO|nr:uncharacterized protein RAG0_03874 [Rhynchosporium agropyri]
MESSQPSTLQAPAESITNQNGQALQVSSPEEEIWDEERLEEAMKTLKDMHIQLRGLRTTVPRLIAPLTTKQPSPDTLFREFSQSANTANQEVQDFRRLMTADESIKVMDQAKKSHTENPKGIKTWKATEHPDWLKKD